MPLTSSAESQDRGVRCQRLRDRYLSCQLEGDRREALRLLIEEGLASGLTVPELQLDVVQEAQREIGRLWQEDRISIAQEHVATAVSQFVLAHLYAQAPAAPSNGKKVLIACVEGELHDMPSRFAADALELAGFDVSFAGANVPTDSLVRMVRESPPDLLALTVMMTFNVPALRAAVQRVRLTDPRVLIAVGGHACEWSKELAASVGADGSGSDAHELVALARRLLGVDPQRRDQAAPASAQRTHHQDRT